MSNEDVVAAVGSADDQAQRRPRVGDIVGYVLEEGAPGYIRPAIIVHVWSEETVNLQVFTNGNGDEFVEDGLPNVVWRTSVMRGDSRTRHSWHWL